MSQVTFDTVKAKLRNATELAGGLFQAPFSLNPCLTEPEVQAFEEQQGITLPDGYRQFLLEVGNGGCGPLLGLYSLDESLRRTRYPLNERFPWIEDPQAPRKRLFAYEPSLSFFGLEEFEDFIFEPPFHGGYLQLGQEYGTEAWLIVTGRERGRVWYSEHVGESDIWPSGLGFLEWYDQWLGLATRQLEEEGTQFESFRAFTPHASAPTSASAPSSLEDRIVLALSRAVFQKDFAAAFRVLDAFQADAAIPDSESLMKTYLKVGTGCLKHHAPELAVQCFETALARRGRLIGSNEDLEPFIQPYRRTLLEALALAHGMLTRP
jgi:hypothetical protein